MYALKWPEVERRSFLVLALEVAAAVALVLSSHAVAARNRAANAMAHTFADQERRPCVLCGGRMREDRSDPSTEWRRCSSCGLSVTGTPWSALVGES